MRIQKYLAQLGHGSRRSIEVAITAGEIKINNKTATLGDKVQSADRIDWLKKNIKNLKVKSEQDKEEATDPREVLLYHKPVGEICTNDDPEGRGTVFDHLPQIPAGEGKLIMIGRLDINTSGLLLFTKDGQLAHELMHPSYDHTRQYLVRVFGKFNEEQLQRLQTGIKLDDGMARFDAVHPVDQDWDCGEVKNYWFIVKVSIGRNRIVRRMWEAVDGTVSRLIRTGFGSFVLPKTLKPGEYIWQQVKAKK